MIALQLLIEITVQVLSDLCFLPPTKEICAKSLPSINISLKGGIAFILRKSANHVNN